MQRQGKLCMRGAARAALDHLASDPVVARDRMVSKMPQDQYEKHTRFDKAVEENFDDEEGLMDIEKAQIMDALEASLVTHEQEENERQEDARLEQQVKAAESIGRQAVMALKATMSSRSRVKNRRAKFASTCMSMRSSG